MYSDSGPRLYQPIWEQLKREGKVSITANRRLHPRIIKAVIKEKWLDLGYKIAIYPWNARLDYTTTHAVITFTLEKRIMFDAIRAKDI